MTRLKSYSYLIIASALLSWLPATSARTITLSLVFAKIQYSALNPNYAGAGYYTVFVDVSSGGGSPITIDEVDAPGSSPLFIGTETGNFATLVNDVGSLLENVTNGLWTLTVNKGDPSQQQYTFPVSVNGLTNGSLPVIEITTPPDGSARISTNTAFAWSGPNAWNAVSVVEQTLDNSYSISANFSPPVSNWQNPPHAILGTNEFQVTYTTVASPWVSISIPTNSQSLPFTNWVASSTLSDLAQSVFATSTNPAVIGTGNKLFAHYTFTNQPSTNTFLLGDDSSPAANSFYGYSYWGPVHVVSTDAVVNGSAVRFFGTSSMDADGPILINYDDLLAGSFSFSGWIKTTNSVGNDTDDAVFGAAIFWAYDDQNNTNDAIPLAVTGQKAAFSVRDNLSVTTTIHSTSTVNDGDYHLITTTRDQNTGVMSLYVDGKLQDSAVGTTNPLNGNNYFISLGGTTISSYSGLLDDVQVYSGALTANEVAALYANPGSTATNEPPQPSYGLIAHYDFDEGTAVAPDVSDNGNNMVFGGDFGGDGPVISTNAVEGLGSVCFDDGSFLTASSNLLSTLSGDFSVSLWLNTTQNYDYAGDPAYYGAGVISAYNPNSITNDLLPIALTGGQVAFDTRTAPYDDDTLTSYASVNDGSWHHIVVCRRQSTGEKDIYVDGVLDNSDNDTTASLNAPQLLTIGAIADASNPDPTSPENTGYNGYQGLVDDIQVYNLVLSSNQVAFLYSNPGLTVGETAFSVLPASRALLGNAGLMAGSFEFSFQTLSGHSHTIQSTTNLLTGSWKNLTNFSGDGTVRQFSFPATNSSEQFFRVETQ